MISFNSLSPRAMEVVVEGRTTAADVRDALGRIDRLIETAPRIDILTDVRGEVHIEIEAIVEELKNLSAIGRMMRALDRVALVADPAWVRVIGHIESWFIPGIDYRVFDRSGAVAARSWILREDG